MIMQLGMWCCMNKAEICCFSRIEAVDGREYYLMNDGEDSDVVGPVSVERLRGKVLSALKVRGI